MLFFGFHNFMYLFASRKKLTRSEFLFFSYLSGFLLGLGVLFIHAFTWGAIALVVLLAMASALTKLSADFLKLRVFGDAGLVVTMPIIRMHYSITALLGLLLLKERITQTQTIGILLSMLVVFIISAENNKFGALGNTRLIMLSTLAAIITAFSSFFAKIGAMIGDVFLFTVVGFFINTVGAFLIMRKTHIEHKTRLISCKTREAKYGVLTGIIHYIAFLSAMLALKELKAAIVFPIVSLSFVVSAFMAVAIFREKFTPNRIAAGILSILAGWLLAG